MVGLVAPYGEVFDGAISGEVVEGDAVVAAAPVPVAVESEVPNILDSFLCARVANEGDDEDSSSRSRELVEPAMAGLFMPVEGAAFGALLVSAAVPVAVVTAGLVTAPLPIVVPAAGGGAVPGPVTPPVLTLLSIVAAPMAADLGVVLASAPAPTAALAAGAESLP